VAHQEFLQLDSIKKKIVFCMMWKI
jgi:hypothetical protein